jgi:transposase InsO family protein
VDITMDYGISGQCVIRRLDQSARFRGYPAAVRTDNRPEFTSRAFIGWAQRALVPDAASGAQRDRGTAARLQRGAASRKHLPRATGAVRREASPACWRCCTTAHTGQQRDPVTFNRDFCRNIGTAEGGSSRCRQFQFARNDRSRVDRANLMLRREGQQSFDHCDQPAGLALRIPVACLRHDCNIHAVPRFRGHSLWCRGRTAAIGGEWRQ